MWLVILRCYVSNVVGASHWFRNNGGIEVSWKLVCSISTPSQSQFLKHRTSAKTMSDQEEPEMKRLRVSDFHPNGDWNYARTRYVLMVLNRLWGDRGVNTLFYTRRIVVYVRWLRQVGCDVHYYDYGQCFCPVQRPLLAAPPSPPQAFWDTVPGTPPSPPSSAE